MNRNRMLEHLDTTTRWDVVIIGGGATGLGAAVDAASRGYRTLLVEQYDFSKGTSSRSTKLVHGGVRYLAQGNIKLVKEALRERGRLLKNAPHITSVQPFIIPVFSWWEKCYYAIGLYMYDLLSAKLSLGKTQVLSKKEVVNRLPAINPKGLSGGILYYDGQFDDSRLSIDLACTAAIHGATLLNYCRAGGFTKNEKGKITGIAITDTLTGKPYTVAAASIINATGVFADSVMQMEDAEKHDMVSPSQGIHLVVAPSFFPGTDAMMIPKTDDGRVLFAVPWHNKIVLGTTDTPVDKVSIEPRALEEEIAFILKHINRYAVTNITRQDVQSIFAGLRPLVKGKGQKTTALLSRDHTLVISPGGLITITGGKWTTYRKMAEDAVDNAVFTAKLSSKECVTQDLPIGNLRNRHGAIERMINHDAAMAQLLHPLYPYTRAEVLYAFRHELAQTVEDVLARRTRLLFLDARAAIESADLVAAIGAEELGKDDNWRTLEVNNFHALAKEYLLA